ncbi:MAG: alpha-hydroxy-acid oxidizing protein [Betaproteobacteria bacterium]|nr:alpha-hydroxy-acid oxidizing protein [Betaproteobacteria bacterium]
MTTSRQELSEPVPAAAPTAGAAARQERKPPRILRHMLALDDFEDAARRYIPRPIFGYVSGGAETNAALRANRAVWDEIAFIPKTLVDTTGRAHTTTLFGRTYDAPFGIAPMGGTAMAAYQGDLMLARAAAAANIPMILSGAALTPLEQIKREGPTAWFQAYLPGDDEVITRMVERVARAGYDTLVLTVDVPVLANRENNVRTGFSTPLRPSPRLAWDVMVRPRWLIGMFLRTLLLHGMPHFENMGPRVPLLSPTARRDPGRRDRLAWKHVGLMRRSWKGRLVVKGILDPEDARIARESGVDGIIVSNHGGRQLDGAAAPIRVLPGIVEQAGAMTVMMDSGVRRGTDVLKALALGAQFVFVGRPFLYAAAIAGEPGVRYAIHLLAEEIHRDMALIGINRLDEMRRELLMPARGSDFLTV